MRAWLLLAVITHACLLPARAEEVTVTSNLSHRVAEVGSQIQLQVEIAGGSGNVNPPDVTVSGLDVRFAFPSTSHQVNIINGRMTSERRTTLVYEIVPQREGDFTIPPIQVAVDGKVYNTTPVGLKVQKRGARGDGGTPPSAVLEIEVKRREVYVGEVVPVEVRLLAGEGMQVREVPNAPELDGDGFTMQKFPRFKETREVRDGREYSVVTFRTAMTPTKAGKLTIGPCEIPFIASVRRPQRAQRGGRSLFEQFFNDDFFNPLGMEQRRFTAKAEAVELHVKPLPVDGRPEDFAGAVGDFKLDSSGTPSTVNLGEPLTMRISITGEGNFDRVQAPVLVSQDGWKAYDASEKFEADNELKTGGTKTFEVPVVPEAKHQQMPQFQFSYFDPRAEKYVTLLTKQEPLVVQGEPLVPPAPIPAAQASPAPAPDASTSGRGGIAGIRYEEGPAGEFSPVYTRPIFWALHAVAALAAVGLIARRWVRTSPTKARAAALRRDRDEVWSRLRRDDEHFYEHAVRLLQVEAALASDVNPSSVDAALAAKILRADPAVASEFEAIFDARAARLYAGVSEPAGISRVERERILNLLGTVCGK